MAHPHGIPFVSQAVAVVCLFATAHLASAEIEEATWQSWDGENSVHGLQLRRLTEDMPEQGSQSGREAQVEQGIQSGSEAQGSPLRRLLITSPTWWQYILLFFVGVCAIFGIVIVCVCAGCCCAEWALCSWCGWGKKKPKASHSGDDSESEELLHDSDQHHQHKAGGSSHHHTSGHGGYVDNAHAVWASPTCPYCGTPYLGQEDSFCRICNQMRDYAGSGQAVDPHAPHGHQSHQQAVKAPVKDKKDKKSKKEKKERRDKRKGRSPNESIQMHAGSPYYRPELEQRDGQGDAVYNMYADVYYQGQHPEQGASGQPKGPIPLPAFAPPTQGTAPPLAKGPGGHTQPGSYASASHLPPHLASSAAHMPPASGAHNSGGQARSGPPSFGAASQEPRVLETIVHEPLLENASSFHGSFFQAPQFQGGSSAAGPHSSNVHSLAMSGSSVRSLAPRMTPPEQFPVRSSAIMATSGVTTPVPHISEERRTMVGEVVHEPVIPQRLGEVLPGAYVQPGSSVRPPVPAFASQSSYASSYQSGSWLGPKAIVL